MEKEIRELLLKEGINDSLITIKFYDAGAIFLKETGINLPPLKNDVVVIKFYIPDSISIMDDDNTHCCGKWKCDGDNFIQLITNKILSEFVNLTERGHGSAFHRNDREVGILFNKV